MKKQYLEKYIYIYIIYIYNNNVYIYPELRKKIIDDLRLK